MDMEDSWEGSFEQFYLAPLSHAIEQPTALLRHPFDRGTCDFVNQPAVARRTIPLVSDCLERSAVRCQSMFGRNLSKIFARTNCSKSMIGHQSAPDSGLSRTNRSAKKNDDDSKIRGHRFHQIKIREPRSHACGELPKRISRRQELDHRRATRPPLSADVPES